jgi:hypothetical protein
MGPALHLIARLKAVENRAKGLGLLGEERLALRQQLSAPLMEKLCQYPHEIQEEVLPKSPAARAVRYALNQWEAPTRFSKTAIWRSTMAPTERANRDIAVGRGYVQQEIMYSRLRRESAARHFPPGMNVPTHNRARPVRNSRLHIIRASGGNAERCRWADSVSV